MHTWQHEPASPADPRVPALVFCELVHVPLCSYYRNGHDMQCETCNALVAEYKRRVKVFTTEVLKTRGAVGPDATLATRDLNLLELNCQDAREAIVAHWRRDHDNLVPATTADGVNSLH